MNLEPVGELTVLVSKGGAVGCHELGDDKIPHCGSSGRRGRVRHQRQHCQRKEQRRHQTQCTPPAPCFDGYPTATTSPSLTKPCAIDHTRPRISLCASGGDDDVGERRFRIRMATRRDHSQRTDSRTHPYRTSRPECCNATPGDTYDAYVLQPPRLGPEQLERPIRRHHIIRIKPDPMNLTLNRRREIKLQHRRRRQSSSATRSSSTHSPTTATTHQPSNTTADPAS